MSTTHGNEKGVVLTREAKRALRAHEVDHARQHDSYSYRFAWDGDRLVEVRAWPDGRSTLTPVDLQGHPTDKPQRLTRVGVVLSQRAKFTLAAAGAVPVLALVVERLV